METKKCSKCHTENPIDAKFCRHCGTKIEGGPEIQNFYAIPSCHVGDSIQLHWNVDDCDKLTLNGINVTGTRKRMMKVPASGRFKLVAYKGEHMVAQDIKINLLPLVRDDVKENNEDNSGKYRMALYLIITILLGILLYFFIEHNTMILRYFNISYSNWTWVSWMVKIVLSISCCYSLVKLMKML